MMAVQVLTPAGHAIQGMLAVSSEPCVPRISSFGPSRLVLSHKTCLPCGPAHAQPQDVEHLGVVLPQPWYILDRYINRQLHPPSLSEVTGPQSADLGHYLTVTRPIRLSIAETPHARRSAASHEAKRLDAHLPEM